MGSGTEVSSVRKSKDSEAKGPMTPSLSSSPMTFRMATEEMLDRESLEASDSGKDSTYGVQSLQDTIYEGSPDTFDDRHPINEAEDESDGMGGRRRSTLKPKPNTSNARERDAQTETEGSSHSHPLQHSSPPSISHSLASLSLDSQAPLSSTPSSPKSYSNRSFRPSDEDSMDEGGSQAIISSSEDDARPSSSMQNSAPQLIMPSIKMPSRRPFTDRGKNMGRLKILLAGDSGECLRCLNDHC